MKIVSLFIVSFFASLSAWAGSFSVDDPRILGQYELVKGTDESEIEDIKIIYNNDRQLVLVRDGDVEYALEKLDKNGLIHESEDECNAGSGDEPNCYYDASFKVHLNETRNKDGQLIPQIVIDVERVDGYEANPDYQYQATFNWIAEIEDAVPFYFNSEKPASLAAILEQCQKDFFQNTGDNYSDDRICLEPDTFVIRAGIEPQKAFASLAKSLGEAKLLDKKELAKVFADSDSYIQYFVKTYRKGDVKGLIAASQALRKHIYANAELIAYSTPIGSMGWLYLLDKKDNVMYRFPIFAKN